jgi:hypothetical protein
LRPLAEFGAGTQTTLDYDRENDRRPDEDEAEVLRQNGLGTARHNCCRWKGSRPMPAARWTTVDDMTAEALRYMIDTDKASLIRSGQFTAEEWDELEREVKASPIGKWDPSRLRALARLFAKQTS